MLADKGELRERSISTWRRVRIAAVAMVVLLASGVVGEFLPDWLRFGVSAAGLACWGFVVGSLVATFVYTIESKHTQWSLAIDGWPKSGPNPLNRLIVKDVIR